MVPHGSQNNYSDGKGIFAKENVVKELIKIGFEQKKTSIKDKETGVIQKGVRILRMVLDEFKKFNPDIIDDDEDIEEVDMIEE